MGLQGNAGNAFRLFEAWMNCNFIICDSLCHGKHMASHMLYVLEH